MRKLRPALVPEGPTDVRFLGPVLRRLCIDLVTEPIEIPESILDLSLPGSGSRAERIAAIARGNRSGFDILFVHSDGAGAWRRALQQQAEPGLSQAKAAIGRERHGFVPVIPVRETEAWCLSDREVLQELLGTVDPLPVRPEQVTDPKAALRRAVEAGVPRRRRESLPVPYALLGEQVRLSKLRELPAFQRLETHLRTELERLGYGQA